MHLQYFGFEHGLRYAYDQQTLPRGELMARYYLDASYTDRFACSLTHGKKIVAPLLKTAPPIRCGVRVLASIQWVRMAPNDSCRIL